MELPAAAAICLGLGLLVKFSSSSKKRTCELLRRAIPVNELKGLGECLEYRMLETPTVVVRGTVGSNSTVENSSLGVFIEETAKIETEKMNVFGSVVPETKTITVSLNEVPWYLGDGTAQVRVCDYQNAEGFFDTLKNYSSTEPVTTYVKFLASDKKEKMLITDADCKKCQKVLEIGTYLTVVGRPLRDKDGAPMIAHAYQFFSGHIQLDEFVADLESELERSGTLSLCLIALGAIFLGLKIMQIDEDVIG